MSLNTTALSMRRAVAVLVNFGRDWMSGHLSGRFEKKFRQSLFFTYPHNRLGLYKYDHSNVKLSCRKLTDLTEATELGI